MKAFIQLCSTIAIGVAIGMVFALHQMITSIEQSMETIDLTLTQIEYAMTSSYDEAIQESASYAPKGFTRWQLRGEAQKTAQAALNRLTEKHNLPYHELPTIRWGGLLNDPAAAGEARNCYVNGRGTPKHFPYRGQISLNEILFLRNYEHFIFIIIPHEVAHVFTCLQGGFVYGGDETDWEAEHGPEWEQAMKDLGFVDPTKFKYHELDMHPVMKYSDTVLTRIGEALGDKSVYEE